MKALSIKELAKYTDQYVALSKDKSEIIASNKSLDVLQDDLEKQKIEGVIIHYIPQVDGVLSPLCL